MGRAPTRRRKLASQAEAPAASVPANKYRGEHTLELAGKTYKLRPSYDAIVEMEDATGHSLMELTLKADGQRLRLPQAAAVSVALIKAGATDPLTAAVSAERIGQLIYEEGLVKVVIRLTLCLNDAVTGGRSALGEVKAAVA